MRSRILILMLLLAFLTAAAAALAYQGAANGQGDAAAAAAPRPPAPGTWSATGTLLEACTCAVPCTCNFGEGPSPHSYCHAVFAYRIDKGGYDGVDLSGLIAGGADGPKGRVGLLDERATPAQRPALEKIARHFFAQGGPAGGARRYIFVPITHEAKGNSLRLDFGERGGFTGRVIVGRDGKSPVVVENNTVWPIRRAIKGKALPLSYRDDIAGEVKGEGSNANYGAFSFSGRVTAAAPPTQPMTAVKAGSSTTAVTDKSCCAVAGSAPAATVK